MFVGIECALSSSVCTCVEIECPRVCACTHVCCIRLYNHTQKTGRTGSILCWEYSLLIFLSSGGADNTVVGGHHYQNLHQHILWELLARSYS